MAYIDYVYAVPNPKSYLCVRPSSEIHTTHSHRLPFTLPSSETSYAPFLLWAFVSLGTSSIFVIQSTFSYCIASGPPCGYALWELCITKCVTSCDIAWHPLRLWQITEISLTAHTASSLSPFMQHLWLLLDVVGESIYKLNAYLR